MRDGAAYTLRPNADIWLDSEEFVRIIQEAAKPEGDQLSLLQDAISLYQGEYLPDAPYETWAAEERERLAALFLESADRLCELYLQDGRHERAIELSQQVLGQDNCWERAYRLMMTAYARQGNRVQALRTYRRCQQGGD